MTFRPFFTSISHGLRTLFTLHESSWRWKVGVYAALGMGVPLALFTLTGHQAEGLVASMGAFTVLYVASSHIRDRARLQPLIALVFVGAAFLGTLVSGSIPLSIVFLIGFASIITITALGVGFGPPGPMMFVLVGGVTNQLARNGGFDDAALGKFTVPLLVTIGAFSSYLVAISPILVPSVRRRHTPSLPLRDMIRFEHWNLMNRIIAYRVIAAVTIATLISFPLGFDHAYWVILVAGVVLQVGNTLRRTMIRATHRVLGTVTGIGAFILLSMLELQGIPLVIVLASLQGLTEVVVTRHYGVALIFITPLALTIATNDQDVLLASIASERFDDTLLGTAIAVFVLLLSEWLINRHRDDRGMLRI